MEYRTIPNTDLRVSEIAFGCGGNAGLMVRGSAAEQRAVIARASALGINYFDNAPDYGDGLAEENLGCALKALGLSPILATKVEVRHADLGDIAGHVVRSLEASLKRLGRDHVDILQIHNGPSAAHVTLEGRDYAQLGLADFLRANGALEGLARAVRQGKARYAGFICRGNDAAEVRQLLETGQFRMINVPYTLLNPTAGMPKPQGLSVDLDFGGVLDEARALGCGTAIYSPLAGGVLAGTASAVRHPLARAPNADSAAYRAQAERTRRLAFLDRPSAHTMAQAAFRFILMHKGVTTVLGGFSGVEQLEELAAVSGAGPLAPEIVARIEAEWRANFGAP